MRSSRTKTRKEERNDTKEIKIEQNSSSRCEIITEILQSIVMHLDLMIVDSWKEGRNPPVVVALEIHSFNFTFRTTSSIHKLLWNKQLNNYASD
jgi:hypothetical protein